MKATIMKRLIASLLAVVAGMFLLLNSCHAGSGSAGKEFYLGFPPNYMHIGKPTLYITSERDTQGSVDVAGLNFRVTFTVQANKVTAVAIPDIVQNVPLNVASRLAVHVVAEDEVTVYGMNQASGTTGAYLGLPVDALGLEYYALAYGGGGAQILLVGAFDGTQISIAPLIAMDGRSGVAPFTINLNRGETHLLTAYEVTGTKILASAPVGVISGSEATLIPSGVSYLDNIVEMMTPVSTWGRSFLTVPLATRLRGDFFRILASENATRVTIDGVLVATLQKGKFFEVNLKSRAHIVTSAPALLAQYSASLGFDGVDGDPAEILVPPAEQFLSKYTFSAPAQAFPKNFVNVTVPTGAIASLQLDGAPVDASLFGAIGTSGFSGAQLPVSPGSHTVNSTDNVPFGIYVYGFGYHDSYGYPGGMSFKAINSTGDRYPPNLRVIEVAGTIQGSASDSEDVNANGILDAGEDLNGNGQIDRRSEDSNGNGTLDAGEDGNANGVLERDRGILKIELLPGSSNLKLEALGFVPGALAAQFNVVRIDPTRPGSGTLYLEDGAGNHVESPIVIGAITELKNVRVVATLSSEGIDIDAATFKKQPYSITDGVNQRIIEWRFDTFKADSNADLGFDVVFKKPIGGEKRVVSQKLDLFYTDANGQAVHTALDARAVDVAPASFVAMPSTDQPSYTAGELVRITSVVKNLSTFNGAVGVRLAVRDAKNALVATLGSLPSQVVGAGGSASFTGTNFAVANTYAGDYKITAELLDSNGVVIAMGYAPFAIIAADAAASVKGTIVTDKQAYSPQEKVLITDRLSNVAINQSADNLRVTTTVRDEGGAVRFNKVEVLPQLPVGNMKDYAYSMPLAFAAAGRYSATMLVSNAEGAQLLSAATYFTVAPSTDSGAGLTGSLVLSDKQVAQGESLALSAGARNGGNATLADLPLRLSIVDVAAGKVVAEFPYVQTLNVGASYNVSSNWTSSGAAGTSYAAVLTAVVGGKTLTLAQDSFSVVARPIKLDLKQTIPAGSRVLVLFSCKSVEQEDKDGDRHDSDDLDREIRYCGDGGDEHDGHQGDGGNHPSSCIVERIQALKTVLDELGVPYQITQTVDGFRRALRSGLYNVYWISNAQYALGNTLTRELREAVYNGDSLITDAGISSRNKMLDELTGVQVKGVIGNGLPLTLSGAYFPTPVTLPTRGRIRELQLLAGAQSQGSFDAAASGGDGSHCGHHDHDHDHGKGHCDHSGHDHGHDKDECHGHGHCGDGTAGTRLVPGVVSNRYGAGRTLVFGFDLVGTLLTQSASWKDVVHAGFVSLTPSVPATLTPGAFFSVKTSVMNLANAVDVGVKVILPEGARYTYSPPGGVYDASNRTVSWAFNLANDQTKDLLLTVQLQNAGAFNLQSLISTIKSGTPTQYGEPLQLPFAATAAAQISADTIRALQALPLRERKEQKLRDGLISELKDVMRSFSKNKPKDYETAIGKLIEMADGLNGLAPVDVTAIHTGFNRILREAQWRWTLLQPPQTPDMPNVGWH